MVIQVIIPLKAMFGVTNALGFTLFMTFPWMVDKLLD